MALFLRIHHQVLVGRFKPSKLHPEAAYHDHVERGIQYLSKSDVSNINSVFLLPDNLFKPKERFIPEKEMHMRSKRIYDNLPEVKKKQEEKQKRIIIQSNRLRVEMFKKSHSKTFGHGEKTSGIQWPWRAQQDALWVRDGHPETPEENPKTPSLAE
ncbi:hypothetical protein WISP_44170 [Willisornis vidua]|uniref:ALMS motif domain-containing protein n=1 Tax=Willisornis vidua TaxID=1566151 RepID=A0ABQ9DKB8_9PASS|nr:hypothetical protein WISP_44170 [Willisornis vidua]